MTSCEPVALREDPRFLSLKHRLGKNLRSATIGEVISAIDRWDADEPVEPKGRLEFLLLFAALIDNFADFWNELDGDSTAPLQTLWERVPPSAVRLALAMMPED